MYGWRSGEICSSKLYMQEDTPSYPGIRDVCLVPALCGSTSPESGASESKFAYFHPAIAYPFSTHMVAKPP